MKIPRNAGPQTSNLPRGHYAKSLRPSQRYGWAIIRCPDCGRCSTIGKNHTVADDGSVSPSYVCPFAPCTWHVVFALADWDRKDMDAPTHARHGLP